MTLSNETASSTIVNKRSGPKIILKPISFKETCEYIAALHRHHKPPQGWKFGVAACVEDLDTDSGLRVVGVVSVGRPVSKSRDDGWTLEVTRLCTDGTPNACSKLYGAARRIAREMGYRLIITYILEEEPGDSLKASGWQFSHRTEGGEWGGTYSGGKKRKNDHPTCPKQMWYSTLRGLN